MTQNETPAPFVPDAQLVSLLDNPHWVAKVQAVTSETGHYEVRCIFQYGPARLKSFRTITARTRQEAVASVEGGQDAEVLEWSQHDPEMVWTRQQLGL